MDIASWCRANVWHAIYCETWPIHGDEGRITLANKASISTSKASDQVFVLFDAALNATHDSFDRCGKVLLILHPQKVEDDDDNIDGSPEAEYIRSQSDDDARETHSDCFSVGPFCL